MKTIRMLEWKRLYPIKKVILAGLWLFAACMCVAGVYGHIRDIDRNSLFIGKRQIIGVYKKSTACSILQSVLLDN